MARLVRDGRVEEAFRNGVVRCGSTLHPIGYGGLEPEQRSLLQQGLHYRPEEVHRLVGELLPSVRGRIAVSISTERLPSAGSSRPRLQVRLDEGEGESLRVLPTIVYGDPVVARVDGGRMMILTEGVVPLRNLRAERALTEQCRRRFGVLPGHIRLLERDAAIAFVAGELKQFNGTVEGRSVGRRFRLREGQANISVSIAERDGALHVDASAEGVSAEAVLDAWRGGHSLVRLDDGGYVPLPMDWLEANGWRLAGLLASRDEAGTIPAHAAIDALALDATVETPMMPTLNGLRAWLARDEEDASVDVPKAIKATLRNYQCEGLAWLRFLREAELGGILADDMGLGKTLQTICVLAETPGPHLVVAPTSVLHGWIEQMAQFWPRAKVCAYHGPNRRLDQGADVVVTTYGLLRRDRDELAEVDWKYLVLDEAQNIKNPDSKVHKAAITVSSQYRLALSGTPIENRLEELWSLFRFVMPGFLGARTAFAEQVSGAMASGTPEALSWLRQRVRPFVLRRLKAQVAPELPGRTDVVLRCTLPDDQRALYNTLGKQSLARAREALGAGRTLGALEALLRLRQVACHPGLLPEGAGTGIESAKIRLLLDTLEQIIPQGHKALIFSQWTGLLDLVEPSLTKAGIAFCRLDGSTRDRAGVVHQFNSEDGPPVFLISLKAGGTGLNLTAADYVLHLDPWWNPAVEDQATDRAHRIGQTKPVVACKLIAADTVEERILALQNAKRALLATAVGDADVLAQQISKDELLALFG